VFVRQFFVRRSVRGRGLGRAFFAALAARFPPRSRVVLEVASSNPRAERFWTTIGFEPYAKTLVRKEP
jgi:GNAT superfamily N-acetyltransferase